METVETKDHVVLLDNQVLSGHQERVEMMAGQDLLDHQDSPDNVGHQD